MKTEFTDMDCTTKIHRIFALPITLTFALSKASPQKGMKDKDIGL